MKKICTSLLAVSLVACTSHQKKDEAVAANGSTTTPATTPAENAKPVERYQPSSREEKAVSYHLPPYQEKLLDNGLRLVFIPDQSLPYVSYTFLVRVGAIQDPEGLGGVSAMVAELLNKGTKHRSAPQIADDLGKMGADFDASSGSEYSMISASAISSQAQPLLDSLFEIVTEPTFSDAEVERVRKQTVAAIQREEDNPEMFSERAFADLLFAQHPYAKPALGTLASVDRIKKKHLIQHYLHFYRPNNTFMAVVGKYSPEFQEKLIKQFSAWQPREVAPAKLAPPAPVQGLQIELVDKPGLVQAQIHIGEIGIARKDPEFLPLRVANTILGGAFASRLVDRVRKELGLTYSINSQFDARVEPGPFQISTFTKNVTIGQTVTETLKVLGKFHDSGVTSGEVDQVKGYLKGIFPEAIETPEKLAFNLLLLRFYDVPDTYLSNYLADVDRLRTSDVNHAISSHFDAKNIKVLVYTNAGEAQEQLQKAAADLGGQLTVKKASDLQ